MNKARKNGTKPKIAPFRLSAKPSIKDAPIFEDVAYTTKKRPAKKLSTSKSAGNVELPVAEVVTETIEQTENVSSSKKRKSSGGFGKIFGDPLKYKVADPFSIMTAEPEEDEPDLNAESKTWREPKAEPAESGKKETAEPCEPETVVAVDEKNDQAANRESAESAEIKSVVSARNESAQLGNANDIQGSLLEQDMLEINADIDSSTLRDIDDNMLEDNLTKKKGEKEKEKKEKSHKKHKKSEKHRDKKKKRRKERNKSEDESQNKRHKKSRRENHSRSRNRSRSRSSSKRRRRNRSEDRSLDKTRRDSTRRDSGRFGSHTSRSRSPIRRERSQNRFSSSPKQKTKERTPPRKRSPLPTTSEAKTVREMSPRKRTLVEKSPRAKSSKEKSPRRLSKGGKSKSPELPNRSKDELERKSREENSSRKNVESRSSVESKRKKSNSDTFSLTTSPNRKEKSESELEVKKSDIVSPKNNHKSPSNGLQLKSYVKVVQKDPKPLVPYDDDIISISPRDNTDGLNVFSDQEISMVPEAEPQKSHKNKEPKHRETDEVESGKKVKGKKKSKKNQGKKRKKKALAKSQEEDDAEKNMDDELEDLLFTKTNKESKEDVFNDSDVFTAKHNLRTAVVDLDRKKLRTVGSPEKNENKLSPLRKETPERKKATPLRKEPLKSKKLSSVAVHAKNSPEPDEPERLSEDLASESLLEPSALDEPPAQAGISTIPFLSVDEEIMDDTVEQTVEYYDIEERIESEPYSPVEEAGESNDAPYSPEEQPVEGNDAPYSPVEGPVSDFGKSSTMNLSDISTKDTAVQETLGIVTTAEKVEDFLGRIQPPEQNFGAADMDMSSPTNEMRADFDNDDDIIEQLHKEFVRTQNQVDVQPSTYMDNHVPEASSILQIPQYPKNTLSPLHTAASDPIVQAYGLNKKYSELLKTKRSKRSKQKKVKNDKNDIEPLDKEKKDIEDALNRVHRQARVEDEMKHALKVYFKRKDITKEEYKMILRKGVPQVANSSHTIDPERIRSLVKKYVAKYKGSRERRARKHSNEQQELPFTFSP